MLICILISGCDTTSKISTKRMGLKAAIDHGFDLLYSFGKEPLTDEMISLAEKYLVFCMLKKGSVTTFDKLR